MQTQRYPERDNQQIACLNYFFGREISPLEGSQVSRVLSTGLLADLEVIQNYLY